MKPISKNAIKGYFDATLNKSKVREAINEVNSSKPKMLQEFKPTISIDKQFKGFGDGVAGFTHGCTQVHIAEWILADEAEAKGVVRHEVAHLVQFYKYDTCKPHGKEFTSALKIVSPTSWRKDRHWRDNPNIAKARKECKAKPNKILLT